MPASPVPLPDAFLDRMTRLLGEEGPAFSGSLQDPVVHGLRVNTLKLTPEQFQQHSPFPLHGKVPWCPSAFHVDGEERPGKHPYHLAGLYYLQEPSAMAPAGLLGVRPGELVLDLAAAPGGKATHLASLMEGRGLLVANEIKTKRVNHLAVNLDRWGAGNAVITNETPERLVDHFGAFFDRVLVDAPCSGEGMFRKDMGARADWSPEMVSGCALRQRNILHLAARLVRPGGTLVYSTCTFAPEEDEQVILGLLEDFPEYEVAALAREHGFMGGRPDWLEPAGHERDRLASLSGAVRLFPHRLRGEGHFVCRLERASAPETRGRRPDPPGPARMVGMDRVRARLWQDFQSGLLSLDLPEGQLRMRGERLYLVPAGLPDFGPLRLERPGVWLGTFKTDRFEPAHPLALLLQPGQARRTLDLATGGEPGGRRSALARYLAGESLLDPGPPGWLLVTVDGWPLGWGKRVQETVKNHYPRGWMIPPI